MANPLIASKRHLFVFVLLGDLDEPSLHSESHQSANCLLFKCTHPFLNVAPAREQCMSIYYMWPLVKRHSKSYPWWMWYLPVVLKEGCLQEKSKHFFQELHFQSSNSLGNCALVQACGPNCQVEISTWIQSTGSGKKYFPPQHSSKLRKSQGSPVRIPLMFLISQMAEWVLDQKRLLLRYKCSVRISSSLSISSIAGKTLE